MILNMSNQEDYVSVVLDLGSQFAKAGFAGESFPRCIIPTAIGRCRNSGLADGFPDFVFGNDAEQLQGVTKLNWPLNNGNVRDWDDVEKLLHHIFYRGLHVPPETANVLYTIHPLTTKKDKEKITEIMFESFMVPNLYLGISPALVLHACGRTSGVVWESRQSCSYVAPVFEGFLLKNATVTSQINGSKLTDTLCNLMDQVGYSFTTRTERKCLQDIKAKFCYVARDYDHEVKSFLASGENILQYELPDGQHVRLGEERFKCPEILFQPDLFGLRNPSIVSDICQSIKKCDLDYKALFYSNIVLSGGSSLFKGLPDRLSLELIARVKNLPEITSKIKAMPSRQLAAWAGGSILASLKLFNGFWMSRDDYDDSGPSGVAYKFL